MSSKPPTSAHRKGFYFEVTAGTRYLWCSCGRSETQPFCDGSHSNLPGGYLTDDPDSDENRKVATVEAGASPIVRLDGECYVFSTSRAALAQRGSMRYCTVVNPALGALFQSQFYAEVTGGSSPVVSADGRHTVLFVSEGEGEIEISGCRFPWILAPGSISCRRKPIRSTSAIFRSRRPSLIGICTRKH